MAGFKIPDFNERTAAARDAKTRALEQLRNRPALDPEVVAARQAAAAAKEAAAAERQAAKRQAIEDAKIAKAEAAAAAAAAKAEAEAAARPAKVHIPTPAEMKQARDARYAARKARNR